jgi:hypothetical protein
MLQLKSVTLVMCKHCRTLNDWGEFSCALCRKLLDNEDEELQYTYSKEIIV